MFDTAYKAMLAGAAISLGGYANMRLGGIAGAFLFSLGLLSVIRFRLPLITGMVCSLSNYKKPQLMVAVMLLNFLGAAIVGQLVDWADIDSQINVMSKLDKTTYQFLFDAFVCGLCVAIAVKARSKLITIMAVMMFVLCGGEHCVADVFYFRAVGLCELSAIGLAVIGNLIGGLLLCKIE